MSSQYGSFGIANKRMWVKPGKLKGILIGEYNTGKTSFLGSNKAALVINGDLSSTPVPTLNAAGLPAQFWPGLNPDGRPINVDGSIIKDFGWSAIRGLERQLIEAAEKNLPRPETIIEDSMTEIFNFLRSAALKHFKKDTWDKGHGEAMWEWLYQELTSHLNNLRDAGYGVWVVTHISPEYITEEDGKKSTRWSLTTPPGFFKRFYGTFECALELSRAYRIDTVPIVTRVDVGGGNFTEMPGTKETKVPLFVLSGENPERAALLKRRVCFPSRIELPVENAWNLFEQEYLKVAVPPTLAP